MEHHPDHSDQIASLNRAKGQLEGVMRLIEQRSYCLEVVYQLRAVRKALSRIEVNVLQKHLNNCVSEVLNSQDSDLIDEKIKEIGQLLRNSL